MLCHPKAIATCVNILTTLASAVLKISLGAAKFTSTSAVADEPA